MCWIVINVGAKLQIWEGKLVQPCILVLSGGLWRRVVPVLATSSEALEGAVYLQNRADPGQIDPHTPPPLRTIRSVSQHHCLPCWWWFRGLTRRPPLCSSLLLSISFNTPALHRLVLWLCCTLYLHSLKTNKEKIDRKGEEGFCSFLNESVGLFALFPPPLFAPPNAPTPFHSWWNPFKSPRIFPQRLSTSLWYVHVPHLKLSSDADGLI